MRTTRKATPVPTEADRDVALRNIERLGLAAHLEITKLAKSKAALDQQYQNLKDLTAGRLKAIAVERNAADSIVQRWCAANPEAFTGESRSLELFGVRFGHRTQRKATKLIRAEGDTKKQTLKGLLAALKLLPANLRKKFIRTTEAVNKDAIIEHIDRHRRLLESRGVTVVQETVFYTDPIAATKPEKTNAS